MNRIDKADLICRALSGQVPLPKNERENTDYYNAFSSIVSSVETVALGLTDSVVEGRVANFRKTRFRDNF